MSREAGRPPLEKCTKTELEAEAWARLRDYLRGELSGREAAEAIEKLLEGLKPREAEVKEKVVVLARQGEKVGTIVTEK